MHFKQDFGHDITVNDVEHKVEIDEAFNYSFDDLLSLLKVCFDHYTWV